MTTEYLIIFIYALCVLVDGSLLLMDDTVYLIAKFNQHRSNA